MTSDLFHDWLQGFDAHFKSQGRKVLSLFDNCCAHGSLITAPELQNVKLYFPSQIQHQKYSRVMPVSLPHLKFGRETSEWNGLWIWQKKKEFQTFKGLIY